MAVEYEVVKFVAEIDMDLQNKVMIDVKNDITEFLTKILTGMIAGAIIGVFLFIGILLLTGVCRRYNIL